MWRFTCCLYHTKPYRSIVCSILLTNEWFKAPTSASVKVLVHLLMGQTLNTVILTSLSQPSMNSLIFQAKHRVTTLVYTIHTLTAVLTLPEKLAMRKKENKFRLKPAFNKRKHSLQPGTLTSTPERRRYTTDFFLNSTRLSRESNIAA